VDRLCSLFRAPQDKTEAARDHCCRRRIEPVIVRPFPVCRDDHQYRADDCQPDAYFDLVSATADLCRRLVSLGLLSEHVRCKQSDKRSYGNGSHRPIFYAAAPSRRSSQSSSFPVVIGGRHGDASLTLFEGANHNAELEESDSRSKVWFDLLVSSIRHLG
jgi:hypothetical protein